MCVGSGERGVPASANAGQRQRPAPLCLRQGNLGCRRGRPLTGTLWGARWGRGDGSQRGAPAGWVLRSEVGGGGSGQRGRLPLRFFVSAGLAAGAAASGLCGATAAAWACPALSWGCAGAGSDCRGTKCCAGCSPSSAPAQHRCSSPGFAGAGWGDTQQYWSPLWAQGAEPACSPLLSPLSPAWGSAWTFMTRCGGAAAPSSALSLFQHGVQAVGPGRETWDGGTSTSVPGADRQ